jgi:hypothetical protein
MSDPGFGVLRKPDGTVVTKTALLATLGAAVVDDPVYQMPDVIDGGYRVLEDIPDPGGSGYTRRLVLAEGTQIRSSEVDTMFPAATFTSISPASAEGAGTAVTIRGTGFSRAGTTVAIGGVACTSVVVVDEETITAVTGAHTAGVVNVVVTTTAGAVTATSAFTYTGDPTITGVAPATGGAAGGTAVTLTGTNYVAGATVTFGGVAATSVVVVGPTSITCATGAHAAGAVNVVVTTAYGAATSVGGFTYT